MDASATQEWLRVPTQPYRRYEVSSDGQVRRNGRTLKPVIDRHGYATVLLYYAGLTKRFKIHRLVCEAFHGPCPTGMECAHLDGDSSNNGVANLVWVTRSENNRHKTLHGTHKGAANLLPGQPGGEQNCNAKLTNGAIREIRRKAAEGSSERSLARAYGISPGQTHKIIAKEAWSHVE